ncbi:MAG: ArsA family ATPase [Acidobacteria bacterium]|nr:MAG: ArsA family ATPase [Acidobacteriota bacterium]MCE7957699.1 ArsA family ATPase [Acidobacteria bacterium ACB2]
MRILLFTGKGGVGKTTVAAATGLTLAARGLKTLVMSVDAAHSLADAFDVPGTLTGKHGGRPVPVAENLWIQEVDVTEEIGRHWKDISGYITTLLAVTGVEEVLAEELAIFPGMDELSALLYVNQYAREGAYDVLILDCAPTGESLRFVSLPPTLDWYMRKLFRLHRQLLRVARPVAQAVMDVPLPPDRYLENVQALAVKLDGVDALLKDPRTTTVRLVTNPEKIVLKETQRAFMYFGLYGFTVDAVIVNRVLPGAVVDPFFDRWRRTQEEFLAEAHRYFDPVPIWTLELKPDQVVGAAALADLGRSLYGPADPAASHRAEAPYRYRKRAGRYLLTLDLPFVSKEEVDLAVASSDLIVRIGNVRHHVPIPRTLSGWVPAGAKVEEGRLTVRFEPARKEAPNDELAAARR